MLAAALLVFGISLHALLPLLRVIGDAVVVGGVVLLIVTLACRRASTDRRTALMPIGGALAALLASTVMRFPSQIALDSSGRDYAWNVLGRALLPNAAGILGRAGVGFAGSVTT